MANDNDDDSDYGSEFSIGAEQLVGKLLEDLVSSNTQNTLARAPSGSTASSATTPSRIHNGEPHALLPAFPRGSLPSRQVAIATTLTSDDDEATSASRQQQRVMSLDSVWYPDCESTTDECPGKSV
jgi:hypothetical protein